MEQKNFLLAVVLSITFLLVWFGLVVPHFAPPPPIQTVSTTNTAKANPSEVPASLEAAHPESAATAVNADSYLRDSQNEIILSSMGGAIRQWRLKLKGQEIDLVESPDVSPLPLTTFPDIPFHIEQKDRVVTMTGTVGKGVTLTKTLALDRDGFLHDYTLTFKNTNAQPVVLPPWELAWGPGLGTASTEQKDNARLTRAISLGPISAHALKPGEYDPGRWVAIDNRYFMVAFLPPEGVAPKLEVTGTKVETRVALRHTTEIPAGGTISLHYQIYAGPKGYTQLKHYGKNLEEGVDFGTFSALGKLILSAIYHLAKWTGNYGSAIILLTMGLQILLLPLTLKSFKTQLAMKRIQPQIAALQAQYKSDPKRLNIEMMNLYKKSGTNPFGGCLPMLLQLPIFWALFTTIRNAYELRGTPFIGWIHDLSAPDMLPGLPVVHVLPRLLGVAMFFQQRAAGAVTDPTQKQMMTIMPVMFTVMFYSFPAGLALYWLTSNVMTVSFQYAFQRYNKPQGKGTPDSPQIVRR
jgi:YidC/Oxa1 family membrane protein insertase